MIYKVQITNGTNTLTKRPVIIIRLHKHYQTFRLGGEEFRIASMHVSDCQTVPLQEFWLTCILELRQDVLMD